MKVVAFLPAKGTSKRIENKNTKLLDGKPLFLHTLEKISNCDFIDEVYLDSESNEVLDLAENANCRYLKRDKKLATNLVDGHELFYNEAISVDADIYIQILCTSPFIKLETIKKGIDVLSSSDNYDSAILIKKEKQYLWKNGQPLYDQNKIPNSFDLDETIVETMGLYIVKKEVIKKYKKRFGKKPFFIEASALEAIDVNYPDDFELASLIAAGKREREGQLFKALSNQMTSSMLSDILDDFGVEGVITDLSLNIKNRKILGRAKTLKLKKIKNDEDYRGIYDALNSYDTIVPNDIIVVENESPEFAYFGEMNANLAIRSGAIGAIVGGKTRDTKEVYDLDFPVFSTGTKCKDVRKRAVVESINKKINLFGIDIRPGDLVFADNDGIIVIPKNIEKRVLEQVFITIEKEKNILSSIVDGVNVKKILLDNGEF